MTASGETLTFPNSTCFEIIGQNTTRSRKSLATVRMEVEWWCSPITGTCKSQDQDFLRYRTVAMAKSA